MTKDTEALREAGEYLITLLNMAVRGKPIRDMDEAIGAFRRAALATPASDVAPVEYDALIAAGFDDYAAHCALRTEHDGGFCHAYFYSDGHWYFQTGGNDLTLPDGKILRCVLTKRLYAHPPHPAPVDPVAGGEALREALAWYGEQARLARLIHSEGDAGRHALAEDGGKRARATLQGPAA